MDAFIVSIGTELVTGQCLDTNAAWLSGEFARSGIGVLGHITVGDDTERVAAAICQAAAEAELVVVTGGIGPTPDDVTRESLATAIGQPLELNPEALAGIEALFARWQRPMDDANRIQAMIPRGCGVIPNERGTAPGIQAQFDGTVVIVLPGVPAEMKAMFRQAVATVLADEAGGNSIATGRLNCFGISESKVGELLSDLMQRSRNPQVGTTATEGTISVRVTARGATPDAAQRLLAADLAEAQVRLGRAVYGVDDQSLQASVAGLLLQHGKTVATAESCTGGLLARRLTDVSGSSAFFHRGYVTYSNESKSELLGVPCEMIEAEGAVSEAVASAMAVGCRTSAGTDYALSITGIAGPTGGLPPDKPVGLVYLGLASADGVIVKRLLAGEHLTRSQIRDRGSKAALNLLRHSLLELGSS